MTALSKPPAHLYGLLRGRINGLTPSAVGIWPTRGLPHVWGLLCDIGTSMGILTLVALADGSTSVYASYGGGLIGAGSRRPVAAATRALLSTVEHLLADFAPTDMSTLPDLPGEDTVSIVVLTYDGRRVASAPLDVVAQRGHPLAAAWMAIDAVLAQLRVVQAE